MNPATQLYKKVFIAFTPKKIVVYDHCCGQCFASRLRHVFDSESDSELSSESDSESDSNAKKHIVIF